MMDSRFVRKVLEVSSHQVATGVLHLLQMVELVRIEGRICPHSMQCMVAVAVGESFTFFCWRKARLTSGKYWPRSLECRALANYKWAFLTRA